MAALVGNVHSLHDSVIITENAAPSNPHLLIAHDLGQPLGKLPQRLAWSLYSYSSAALSLLQIAPRRLQELLGLLHHLLYSAGAQHDVHSVVRF